MFFERFIYSSLNKFTLSTGKLSCLVTWCMSYYKNRAVLWHNTFNLNHIPFIIIRWLQHNLNGLLERKNTNPNFKTIFKRDIVYKNLVAGCWKTKQNKTLCTNKNVPCLAEAWNTRWTLSNCKSKNEIDWPLLTKWIMNCVFVMAHKKVLQFGFRHF